MDEAERVLPVVLEEGAYREFPDYAGGLFRSLAKSPDTRYEQVEYVYAQFMHLLRKYAAKNGTSLPPDSRV